MTIIRTFALCAALGLALSACSEGTEESADDQAPAAASDAQQAPGASSLPATPGPDSVVPVEVTDDAVTVGTTLANDRAVKSALAQFTTSDTVYASAAVPAKPGASVSVYWTFQDGTTHKEETKELAAGDAVVTFAFAKADGMVPGKYNVQIDRDMTPVGIADFVIR